MLKSKCEKENVMQKKVCTGVIEARRTVSESEGAAAGRWLLDNNF